MVPALTRLISCWLLRSATNISWFTVASRVSRSTSCWVVGSSLTRASSLALSSVRRDLLVRSASYRGWLLVNCWDISASANSSSVSWFSTRTNCSRMLWVSNVRSTESFLARYALRLFSDTSSSPLTSGICFSKNASCCSASSESRSTFCFRKIWTICWSVSDASRRCGESRVTDRIPVSLPRSETVSLSLSASIADKGSSRVIEKEPDEGPDLVWTNRR